MRNAVLRLPSSRTANERRQVLRAAIRQLERADIYLAAVACMELGDWASERALASLRTGVESLRRHLAEQITAAQE